MRALAQGQDHRPVETSRKAKSISEERTYVEDMTDEGGATSPDEIRRLLVDQGFVRAHDASAAALGRLIVNDADAAALYTSLPDVSVDDVVDVGEVAPLRARRQRKPLAGAGRLPQGRQILGLRVAGHVERCRACRARVGALAGMSALHRAGLGTDAVRNGPIWTSRAIAGCMW